MLSFLSLSLCPECKLGFSSDSIVAGRPGARSNFTKPYNGVQRRMPRLVEKRGVFRIFWKIQDPTVIWKKHIFWKKHEEPIFCEVEVTIFWNQCLSFAYSSWFLQTKHRTQRR